jgi:hypothetical protein
VSQYSQIKLTTIGYPEGSFTIHENNGPETNITVELAHDAITCTVNCDPGRIRTRHNLKVDEHSNFIKCFNEWKAAYEAYKETEDNEDI